VHLGLFEAFFARSRNIADPAEVLAVVGEAGIDTARFTADYRAGAGREAVIRDYRAAVEDGVRAIPTVIFPDTGAVLVGLVDQARYRAAVEDAARC
jgi:predicted DsbA family dithiol-disulfide isomerase